ncbi:hypothetical protein V1514DRAFT_319446 [Lipomyces japonicus]|uniref:uncharacterized protein n=1 Tax=Lipomyces japonicus TaxID=56871 RepID=UPI0034CF2AA5
MSEKIRDKNDNPINKDDTVYTKFRGGKREGKVIEIVETSKKAEQEHVKNPPKVLFQDQHGHTVTHNPETLEDLDAKK